MLKNIITAIKNLNLANKITLVRIFAIFPVIFFLSFPSPLFCFLATVFFTIACISDALDGYVARRDKAVTTFGKFLDPLADKLLICSVFIQLVELDWVPAWIVILIIMRELAVTGLRAVAADEGVVIAADKYGKLKTIFQTLALGPLIYHYPLWILPSHEIGMLLLVIALILTMYSGVRYFYIFYQSWAHNTHVNAQDNIQNEGNKGD